MFHIMRRSGHFGTVMTALAIGLTTVTAAACGTAAGLSGTATPNATPGRSTTKPPLTGLLDMGVQTAYQSGQPFSTTDPSILDAYAGAFSGIVVNESWSQLEPSPAVENWSPLDASLSTVLNWNQAHPTTPLGVKLRIFAGYSAPDWVVSESGPPVDIVTGRKGRSSLKVIGRWWTTPFRQAWNSFQHALAARYDSNPLVRQVSVSSCSSSTGEPFVVSGNRSSLQSLAAAGWTPQLQEQCLDGALADYSGWKHTPITFAFNSLITSSGPNASIMTTIMQKCAASRVAGGPTCILGNNDLSSSAPSSRLSGPAYTEIASLEAHSENPPTVYFQTSGAAVNCADIVTGLSYHTSSIELWPPNGHYRGFAAVPLATLKRWNGALTTGSKLAC